MILKILLVLGVIAVIYFVFIKKKPSIGKDKNDSKTQSNDMVECASCGIYVEVGEAILSNGKYYCSQECVNKA